MVAPEDVLVGWDKVDTVFEFVCRGFEVRVELVYFFGNEF
jgi:hypothetical protein